MASSDGQGCALEVRLTQVTYGAEGINLYRLTSLDGRALPSFEPGAHIDIDISADHRRQYSLLWPAPAPDSYVVAVQLSTDGRGGSSELHYRSVVGQTYRISAPRNHFALHDDAARYALFAGGIGITPVVSMFRKLKQAGKPVVLHYWTASSLRTLFLDELAGDPDVRLLHGASGAAPPIRLADVLGDMPMDTQLYCCGPEAMLTDFDRASAAWPESMTHRERFAPPSLDLPGDAFQVTLRRSNQVFVVGADETLLARCLDAGIDVSYSCEEGVCGACEVKVLAGKVDHRDSVLSAAQQARSDTMMICCSRGVGSGLVLDL
jgi:ferredoxin-NADP reductase